MKNFVLYKGPSVLDGAPIVVLAVVKSSNAKTGSMVQTYILRDDVNPVEASQTGNDQSVCGNCPLRQGIGGACYVNIGQGPNSAWKAYKRGNYAEPSLNEVSELLRNKAVRLGSYGDPAAVPFDVWSIALKNIRFNTGYTHQAKHANFDARILKWCMVSAETAKQAQEYHRQGYRTFRVIGENNDRFDNEFECLSDDKGLTCLECKACDSALTSVKSVTVTAHGSRGKKHSQKYHNANLIAIGG